MNNSINYFILSLVFSGLSATHFSCSQDSEKINLEYDHIVLFIDNSTLKDSLDKYFTPADKLTTEHRNQGTVGYYYLFYNTYIELLFLKDPAIARMNRENFGSDYVSRWTKDDENCPIGFGMVMSQLDSSLIKKGFHKYRSNDSPDDEYYLMSKYNTDLKQPLIYVSMPHRAYKTLKSIEEIDQRPEQIRKDLKNYLTHSSHVKNVSQIVYSYSSENKDNENIEILEDNPKIQVERADSTSLTLIFDNRRKKRKEFRLNDQIKLIINY